MARREDILTATLEAVRFHEKYQSEERAKSGEGRIDVFGMLIDRDIPVVFRPLRNLLGAYIDEPCQGVMVTTQRQLPVQRFTAAHELGHAALGHETSLDEEEILTRALFDSGASFDPREIQANAFATELLTPQWLIVEHMARQGWKRESLVDPIIVYQLALRMGSSYTATCFALQECKGIDRHTTEKLLKIKPRTIKQELAKPYKPQNWYGDVWLITERDHGMFLEGSRSDLVVLRILEHANSGYVWNLGELVDAGLTIRQDGHIDDSSEHLGGIVCRNVVAEAQDGASGHVWLREQRPWQAAGEPLNVVELKVDLLGPMQAGWHPMQRNAALSGAA